MMGDLMFWPGISWRNALCLQESPRWPQQAFSRLEGAMVKTCARCRGAGKLMGTLEIFWRHSNLQAPSCCFTSMKVMNFHVVDMILQQLRWVFTQLDFFFVNSICSILTNALGFSIICKRCDDFNKFWKACGIVNVPGIWMWSRWFMWKVKQPSDCRRIQSIFIACVLFEKTYEILEVHAEYQRVE